MQGTEEINVFAIVISLTGLIAIFIAMFYLIVWMNKKNLRDIEKFWYDLGQALGMHIVLTSRSSDHRKGEYKADTKFSDFRISFKIILHRMNHNIYATVHLPKETGINLFLCREPEGVDKFLLQSDTDKYKINDSVFDETFRIKSQTPNLVSTLFTSEVRRKFLDEKEIMKQFYFNIKNNTVELLTAWNKEKVTVLKKGFDLTIYMALKVMTTER
ncbi:hypothetical protein ACFLSE_06830 [Bacteroidota bacterium]